MYRALWGDKEFALKWYYEQSATPQQRLALETLIKEGSPSNCFLWPEDLAIASGVRGFGYLMPIRDSRYKSLTDLVAGRVAPSFLALITAGIELTKAFRHLHAKGLCYRDISFGNAFFDPTTGHVLVCDNDNVTTNRSKQTGMLGTPDFMAPEIVRGEALPSSKTDLYSLSILLFYLFHVSHPLCGQKILNIHCWDGAARELLFGIHPLFIFDPNDNSNAAVADKKADPLGEAGGTALTYWKIYPQTFRGTFTKAFTVGLHDPDARVTELEWLIALSGLRDALFKCVCGTPNFYDSDAVKLQGAPDSVCWACGALLRLPFRMRIGKSVIMLNADTKLYPHHLADGRDFDYSSPVGEVVRHPNNPNVWGLKNLTTKKWIATLADGTLKDAEPGRSVPLASKTRISFGKSEGEIRY